MAKLEAAPSGASAAELLADVRAAVTKAPAKLTTPLVARLLTLLPRMHDADAARAAGVQLLDALARKSSALDACVTAAVTAYAVANATDSAVLAALCRLARRAAFMNVGSTAALVEALAGTPALHAKVLAGLTRLLDVKTLGELPAASLPQLMGILVGDERLAAAPEEARALGVCFIAALQASKHGIPNHTVADALAAHAGRVACGETNDALVALVRARAGTQLANCVALAQHAAVSPRLRAGIIAALMILPDDAAVFAAMREPDVTQLCTLLLSEPGCEGHAVRLIAALAASSHGIASPTVSAAVADFSCRAALAEVDAAVVALVQAHARRQLSAVIEFVRALELFAPPRAPTLFAAALAALMASTTGDEVAFSALAPAAVVQLAELVFSQEASWLGAGEALAAAVLAVPTGPAADARYKALFAASHVRDALSHDAGAARILAARIAQLSAATAGGPPVLSWAQPAANFPANAVVESFLRGPEQQRSFRCFTGIVEARSFVHKHFGPSAVPRSYDVTATVGGSGRKSYAVIKKNNPAHQRAMQVHATAAAQLAELRALQPKEQADAAAPGA